MKLLGIFPNCNKTQACGNIIKLVIRYLNIINKIKVIINNTKKPYISIHNYIEAF